MFEKAAARPFRLISLAGCAYIVIVAVMNALTGFLYQGCIFPAAEAVTFSTEGAALILLILAAIFDTKHLLCYAGIELLVLGSLYTADIYIALFLSSILLVLLLASGVKAKGKAIIIYSAVEVAKLALVIPYGALEFFRYVGLTLFALCAIGCINLLFRHAVNTGAASSSFNLEDYKLTDRQKDCIKEVVVNNTTIKALAITHNVSESAIKKDLATVYKVLGITGKADLKALFIGYEFD